MNIIRGNLSSDILQGTVAMSIPVLTAENSLLRMTYLKAQSRQTIYYTLMSIARDAIFVHMAGKGYVAISSRHAWGIGKVRRCDHEPS